MSDNESRQKKAQTTIDLAQTIVLRAEPAPRAPETAQTQVLPFDIEEIRARAQLMQRQHPGSEGKTMILWASNVSAPPARSAPLPLATALAKTIDSPRPNIVAEKPKNLLETLVYKRAGAAAQRTQLQAVIAAGAVALACGFAWQFTAQTSAPAVETPRPEASPQASPTPKTSAPSQALAVAAPTVEASSNIPTHPSERAAVDALHAGDYARAAQHYQALARAYPDRREFSEALHILQRAERSSGSQHW